MRGRIRNGHLTENVMLLLGGAGNFRFPRAMVAPARPQSAPLAAPWTPALEGDSEIWLRAPVSGSRPLWWAQCDPKVSLWPPPRPQH